MKKCILALFLLIFASVYFKQPQKVNFVESKNDEIKKLEIRKAEIICEYHKNRYLNLKSIYKDAPQNKDLREAELNYKINEIDLEIIKIISNMEH